MPLGRLLVKNGLLVVLHQFRIVPVHFEVYILQNCLWFAYVNAMQFSQLPSFTVWRSHMFVQWLLSFKYLK